MVGRQDGARARDVQRELLFAGAFVDESESERVGGAVAGDVAVAGGVRVSRRRGTRGGNGRRARDARETGVQDGDGDVVRVREFVGAAGGGREGGDQESKRRYVDVHRGGRG